MGIFNKTKKFGKNFLADEEVRQVDPDSDLPNWTPPVEEPEEKESKMKLPVKKDKPKSKTGKSKNISSKTSENDLESSAISSFKTWDDDIEDDLPQTEITLANDEDDTESSDSNEFEDFDEEDDSVTNDSESSEDYPELDPSLFEEESDSDFEIPEPNTVATGISEYADEDLYDDVDNSSNVEDKESINVQPFQSFRKNTMTEGDDNTSENPQEDLPMTFEEIDELSEKERAPEYDDREVKKTYDSSDEVLSDFSNQYKNVDLRRAISLDALDNVTFANEDDGYGKANVDAMMSYLRLSLDLYKRRVDQLDSLAHKLSDEIVDLGSSYKNEIAKNKAMVSFDSYSELEDERDVLRDRVKNLSIQLGLNPDEQTVVSDSSEDQTMLTFGGPVVAHNHSQKIVESQPEVIEEKNTPSDNFEKEDDANWDFDSEEDSSNNDLVFSFQKSEESKSEENTADSTDDTLSAVDFDLPEEKDSDSDDSDDAEDEETIEDTDKEDEKETSGDEDLDKRTDELFGF